ncbi:hypothetical protein HOG48_03370 [Candidatus Peregrinibacteria bacterium]|jgi:hypothetical protein|nr:hypothetical protein [Candidatus Peregrinibacteria bacterium]
MDSVDVKISTDPIGSGPSSRQLELLMNSAHEYGHILMIAFDEVVEGFDGIDNDGENTITREIDGYEVTFKFDASYDIDSNRTWVANEVLKVKNSDGVEFRIDPGSSEVTISNNDGFYVRLVEEGAYIEAHEAATREERMACLILLDKVADLLDKLKPQVDGPEQEGVKETRDSIVALLKGF